MGCFESYILLVLCNSQAKTAALWRHGCREVPQSMREGYGPRSYWLPAAVFVGRLYRSGVWHKFPGRQKCSFVNVQEYAMFRTMSRTVNHLLLVAYNLF